MTLFGNVHVHVQKRAGDKYHCHETDQNSVYFRMLDIKANFKNKYQQQKCRMCNEPIETQEHILETCPGLHTTNKTKVYKNEIFDEDTNNLKLTAAKITQTMAQLNQNNNHTQSTDPNNV